MNKKPMILAIASLGSVALIGTGFAGWVISTEAVATANGSISAYTVTDKRIVIGAAGWGDKLDGDNPIIKFAEPASDDKDSSITKAWLTFTGENGATESLGATYNIYYWCSDAATTPVLTVKNTTYTGAWDDTNGRGAKADAYIAALGGETGSYITGPAAVAGETYAVPVDVTTSTAGVTYDVADLGNTAPAYGDAAFKGHTTANDGKYYRLTITYAFGWGTITNGKNPYNYFNTKVSTAPYSQTGVTLFENKSYADVAKSMLNTISDVNATNFRLDVNIAFASAGE